MSRKNGEQSMITKQGNYVNKADGQTYDFDFEVPNDVMELVSITTAAERDKLALRMFITDARNNASAKAQAENGHNQRVMTEEQKAAAKAERQMNAGLLAKIKAMSPEERAALGL
jgi:hypothetical protein